MGLLLELLGSILEMLAFWEVSDKGERARHGRRRTRTRGRRF